MNDVPPYLVRLLAERRISRSRLASGNFTALKPLFAGGILDVERAGRGEIVVVRNYAAFEHWLRQRFPSMNGAVSAPDRAHRAAGVALRRDSKAMGRDIASGVVHFRALGTKAGLTTLDHRVFPVEELTAQYGIAACLIGEGSSMRATGKILVIENLECFLHAELLVPNAKLALNAAGRISARIIGFLRRSQFDDPPLLHLPDYDPVGLSDYLRLRQALTGRIELFVPDDLEDRFSRFANRALISAKPRNRALLERLGQSAWPCAASARVFNLIKETGSGLEQEALLINADTRVIPVPQTPV